MENGTPLHISVNNKILYLDEHEDQESERLDAGVLRMIGLLGFFNPENIPLNLLVPGKKTRLPEYRFLENRKRLKRILLKVPKVYSTFSPALSDRISTERWLHNASMSCSPLILEHWRELSLEDRELGCQAATTLLVAKFPQRKHADRILVHENWESFMDIMGHVEHLAARHQDLERAGFSGKIANLPVLLSDAAWFFNQTGFPSRALRLIRIAMQQHTKSNDHADPSISVRIRSTRGAIEEHLVHYADAIWSFYAVLRKEEARRPLNPITLSFAHSAFAYALLGVWRHYDAIVAANKAISIFEVGTADKGVDEKTRLAYQPDILHRNLARAYFFAGDFEEARKGFEVADEWATRKYGERSHYHGEISYSLARIAMAQHDYKKAFTLLCKARLFLRPERMPPLKPTGASAAVAFELGRVLTRLGKIKEALDEFQYALFLTEFNVKRGEGLGERARIQWYMAEAMNEVEGKKAEAYWKKAEELREEAIKVRGEQYATGKFVKPMDGDKEKLWDGLVRVMCR